MSIARRSFAFLLLAGSVACNDQASRPDRDVDTTADAADVTDATDAADTGADSGDALPGIDVPIVACDKEDDLSPNHAPAEATPVEGGTLEAEALYVCADTDDWFAVDGHAGQTLTARIEFADRIGDLDLYVLPAGTADLEDAVDFSATREDIEELAFDIPSDGTWYVVVDSFEGSVGVYDLSVALSCRGPEDCAEGFACSFVERRCVDSSANVCGDDEFEPNDSATGATPVEIGGDGFAFLHGLSVCHSDDDYFALVLDAPATVNAELAFNARADLDLYVFDAAGDVLAAALGTDASPELLTLPFLPPGTWYFAVDYYVTDGGDEDYNLTLEVVPGECVQNTDCRAEGRALCEDGACVSFEPETPSGPGGTCDDQGDCAEGLECYGPRPGIDDNFCTVGCSDDGDCDAFEDGYCLGFGRGAVCYDACTTDAECPTYYACTDAHRCDLIDCGTDSDCGDGRVCRRTEQDNSGFCTSVSFAGCADDDAHEENDTVGAAVAASLDGLDDLSICDTDDDWYVVTVLEDGTRLDVTVEFDTAADIDVFVLDADGRTVGAGTDPDANPEVASARALAAGDYFVRVNQFPGDESFATAYSLSFETAADTCTVAGEECLDLEPLRIVCDEDGGGVCRFFDGDGDVELGGTCDSTDDCTDDAHFCWTFEPAAAGNNICTFGCGEDPDCEDVPGTTCHIFGRGFGACLPGE